MTDDAPLRILLVEDNQGDARYIQELLREETDLALRIATDLERDDREPDGGDRSVPTLVHETRLSAGINRLDEVDVVLLDLNLPDSEGLETLTALRERADIPVVVLTGLSTRELGPEAIRAGAEEYLVKDEINSALLMRSVVHAIQRRQQDRELKRQREQLASLNSLYELVSAITHRVIESSSREEIETLVCERLAEADSYLFAWIGEVAGGSHEVTVRTEAGVSGYLADVSITTDDSETGNGPTGRAFRTGDVQAVQRLASNPEYGPWRDHAREYGVRASAAIPITHEGTIYGVLNVYTDRRDAFGPGERSIVGQLGEIIGHAIAAIERRDALLSEELTEVEFEIPDAIRSIDPSLPVDGTITFDRMVAIDEDVYLAYGTVPSELVETLRSFVEHDPYYEDLTVYNEGWAESRFEVRLSNARVLSEAASIGGRIQRAEISDGAYRLTVALPAGESTRGLVDAVEASYPTVKFTAQRRTTQPKTTTQHVATAFAEELTDRQRTVLEAGYFAGFFDWPRTSTGEEVAESLGISAPTFHQHVRKGERKLLGAFFDDSTDGDRS